MYSMYLFILLTCTYNLCLFTFGGIYLEGTEIISFVCFVVSVVSEYLFVLPLHHYLLTIAVSKYIRPLSLAF